MQINGRRNAELRLSVGSYISRLRAFGTPPFFAYSSRAIPALGSAGHHQQELPMGNMNQDSDKTQNNQGQNNQGKNPSQGGQQNQGSKGGQGGQQNQGQRDTGGGQQGGNQDRKKEI
jgi:hypothetical protein